MSSSLIRPDSGRAMYASPGSLGFKATFSPRSPSPTDRTGSLLSPEASRSTLSTRRPSSLRAISAFRDGTHAGSFKGSSTRSKRACCPAPEAPHPTATRASATRKKVLHLRYPTSVVPVPFVGGGDGEAGQHREPPRKEHALEDHGEGPVGARPLPGQLRRCGEPEEAAHQVRQQGEEGDQGPQAPA